MARPKGTPKTGGREKGTPNKISLDVKELAQEYTSEAVEALATIMRDGDSAAARVAAIKELLDRAHGKPKQAVDVAGALTVNSIKRTIVDPKP